MVENDVSSKYQVCIQIYIYISISYNGSFRSSLCTSQLLYWIYATSHMHINTNYFYHSFFFRYQTYDVFGLGSLDVNVIFLLITGHWFGLIRLLDSVIQALLCAGIDLSEATISTQINFGNRANQGMTPGPPIAKVWTLWLVANEKHICWRYRSASSNHENVQSLTKCLLLAIHPLPTVRLPIHLHLTLG